MKKNCIFCLAFIVLCTSCSTILSVTSTVANTVSTGVTNVVGSLTLSKSTKKDAKNGNWDLSKLDTARGVTYLSTIEKDIILETNMARTDPKKYAELYIEPRIKNFKGKLYDNYWRTEEGASAVRECVKEMKKQKPVGILEPSKALSKASEYHATMQSRTNQTGHVSPDGSTMEDRVTKYGNFYGYGENIDYGQKSAREIIVSLLIDDGVPSRGHRINIYNENYTLIGLSYIERHKTYGSECVINYAYGEH